MKVCSDYVNSNFEQSKDYAFIIKATKLMCAIESEPIEYDRKEICNNAFVLHAWIW